MKFTEGTWEKNERAHMVYAVQAYQFEIIENGIRITAPAKKIRGRADALDTPTITTEITGADQKILRVRSYHFQGYVRKTPKFQKKTHPVPAAVEETEREVILRTGAFTVKIEKEEWQLTFEAGGKRLTSCGFRNLGYAQYDRRPLTILPGEGYMRAQYQPYMVSELSLNPGACVYGLGERFTAFVKNGQTVDCWNEDGGTSSQISYKNVPFYMTNQGYGVFVDHTDPVSFEIASEKVEYVGASVPGEEISYYLIYGENMKEILEGYTGLTGRPALPPAWSFGLWLSTSFTTEYDERTANEFIRGMREREIPIRVFHFDCFWMRALHWCDFEWDPQTFPDVPKMLSRYREQGLKICVWINPYIAQGTKMFQEGMEHHYLLMRADGKGVKQIDNWQPGMGLVDFTNAEAAEWYCDRLRRLIDLGVDCFKTDFGERIPVDVVYADGSDPLAMHNYYTYLYNKCVYQVLKEKNPGEPAVLFARSATAGCQQFPVHWGGDCNATFPSMAETLRGGLSFLMSGFAFWSHDMGGFEMTSSPAVYKRWVQFGLLSTHSRLHGSKSYRVPWLFDEEASDVCREFTRLKYRLMPYLYGMAAAAHETGVPVMRPMVLEFEDDPATAYLDMQYMLGDIILAAPVFREDQRVDYYLPEGIWTHLLSGECRMGGRWYRESYDFHSLPLFVRPNSILPLGSCCTRPDYCYTDGLELHIFQMKEGQTAHCSVPDLDGKEIFRADAVLEQGCLNIQVSKLTENLNIILRGIDEIVRADHAMITGTNQGILLRPEDTQIKVWL
ncbi:alpha-xylosidase [Diplocloster hominis]|uniref:alpha-xylosidase n=1 Tax=Diplocloster hominis TaxID=3079010 RepID=UPI0031B9D849